MSILEWRRQQGGEINLEHESWFGSCKLQAGASHRTSCVYVKVVSQKVIVIIPSRWHCPKVCEEECKCSAAPGVRIVVVTPHKNKKERWFPSFYDFNKTTPVKKIYGISFLRTVTTPVGGPSQRTFSRAGEQAAASSKQQQAMAGGGCGCPWGMNRKRSRHASSVAVYSVMCLLDSSQSYLKLKQAISLRMLSFFSFTRHREPNSFRPVNTWKEHK
eukprot:scaffold14557_cov67-Attheya_sp.AAC.6